MLNKINKVIEEIEKEEDIKVILLVESGSRAWGWKSKDSDYDLRGVFVKKDTIFNEKLQINRKIKNLDIELWNFKKFLRLMSLSNPSVWEWLSSDIVYINNGIKELLHINFLTNCSLYTLKKHYVSMARQNFEKYINQIGDKANLKKYTYVLRSIACVNYIEERNSPPPKHYKYVIKYLPKEVREFCKEVIRKKKESENLTGNRNKLIEKYIISFWNKDFERDKSNFDLEWLERVYENEKRIYY